MSGGGPLPGLQMTVCSRGFSLVLDLEKEEDLASLPLLMRTLTLSQGPTLMTLFEPNYFSKVVLPNIFTYGLKAST